MRSAVPCANGGYQVDLRAPILPINVQYHPYKLIRQNRRLSAVMFLALGVSGYAILRNRSPRPWGVDETPVAFWAWQEHSPTQSDIRAAVAETGATALFMHAGQLELEAGNLRRIRAVQGSFPSGIAIHLVYNATRSLLAEFERVDEAKLAEAILKAYGEDITRASADGALLTGLQLDIDVPTRLLDRYARLLRLVREQLPKGQKLSITGLPTWMDSRLVEQALDTVDFWIPQCYGAKIPERLDSSIPISSPQTVARAIDRARQLGRPFYAGLAAYGYALHYSTGGSLVSLRGDLDPASIANRSDLEMVDRRPFDGPPDESAPQASIASEWRYVYKARSEAVVDGTVVRSGESLMLDVPSAESLRAAAKAVRTRAGKNLLGICVFRLPAAGDPANLTVNEISAALADRSQNLEIQARATVDGQNGDARRYLALEISNTGSVRPIMGHDGLVLDLRVPPGVFDTVDLAGFASMEPLCAPATPAGHSDPRPCGAARANNLRLTAVGFRPGATARADFQLTGQPPEEIPVHVSMNGDGGLSFTDELLLKPKVKNEP